MSLSREEIWWINKHVPMRDYMVMYGYDVMSNGQCFCPFHENKETPAAKFFENSNNLFCFFEHRSYGTYMLLRARGWDEEKIRTLLPDEFEYIPDDVEVSIPVIPDEIYSGDINVFMLLHRLRMLWVDKDKAKKIIL